MKSATSIWITMQLGKTRFHKSQAFDFKEDLAVVGLSKPGIGGKLLPGQSSVKNNSVYPKGLGGDKPAWVAFDKQVYGDSGWFKSVLGSKETLAGSSNACSNQDYTLV